MPYIVKDRRPDLTPSSRSTPQNPGELNFQFTQLVYDYVNYHGISYQIINDVIGALEGAKAEFQRRVVGPYEDTKIKENGDLY